MLKYNYVETGLNATWDDLAEQIAKMTPEQRKCNLAVRLGQIGETLSSTGASLGMPNPDIVLTIAGDTNDACDDTLDFGHPVILIQY